MSLESTPLLPHTPPPRRSNVPDRIVYGSTIFAGLGVGIYVASKMSQSEPLPQTFWTTIGLGTLCVLTGIWGFFRPRNVTIISPVPNQADVATGRVTDSIREASLKLERLIERFSHDLHKQNGVVAIPLDRSQMRDVELGEAIQPTIEDLVRGLNSNIDAVERVIASLEAKAQSKPLPALPQSDKATQLAMRYLGELDRNLDGLLTLLSIEMPIVEQEAISQEPIEVIKTAINAKLQTVSAGIEELNRDYQTLLEANLASPMKDSDTSDDGLMARVNAVTSTKRARASLSGLRSGSASPYSARGPSASPSVRSPAQPITSRIPPPFSLAAADTSLNGDLGKEGDN